MKTLRSVLIVTLTMMAANLVLAGPYSDTLSKKLVSSTTAAEKAAFVRWMFVAMSLHPDLKNMSSITPEQREEANRELGKLMTRMFTETCAVEAKEAMKYEGPQAISGAFNLFGQIAARELFTNPEVNKGLAELEKHCDMKAIESALSDKPPTSIETK